jgi:ATP-dependent Clp protease adaptor protein ClpS
MTNFDFQNQTDSSAAVVCPGKNAKKQQKNKDRSKKEPKYHVVLWNDEVHTFDYVVHMLWVLFGYSAECGWRLALEVDGRGTAIIYTSSLERAEIKRDQILAFGPDPFILESKGPLIATLERDRDESK